jgi:hypothetical protein
VSCPDGLVDIGEISADRTCAACSITNTAMIFGSVIAYMVSLCMVECDCLNFGYFMGILAFFGYSWRIEGCF